MKFVIIKLDETKLPKKPPSYIGNVLKSTFDAVEDVIEFPLDELTKLADSILFHCNTMDTAKNHLVFIGKDAQALKYLLQQISEKK